MEQIRDRPAAFAKGTLRPRQREHLPVWPRSRSRRLLRSTPIANMEAAANTPGGCGARPGISPSSRARPGSHQVVSKV